MGFCKCDEDRKVFIKDNIVFCYICLKKIDCTDFD